MTPLRVFLGYDRRQPLAVQVLAHSIWAHATQPVSITPLHLTQLPISRRGLTEFTYSRFLVPWLCDYQGYAVFIDSDFLCRADIAELYQLVLTDHVRESTPVWVAKHALRFEWASLMVFNNAQCAPLTPTFVQDESHNPLTFAWARRVGELPGIWNHLVGYDLADSAAKMVHFTCGIPCWPETEHHEYADEWRRLAKQSMTTVSFDDLMGQSVHAPRVKALMR